MIQLSVTGVGIGAGFGGIARIGGALLVTLSLVGGVSVQAKPITTCGSQAQGSTAASCAATPKRLAQPAAPVGKVARVTTPASQPAAERSIQAGDAAALQGSAILCAQLRGSHEAERTLLQSIQSQVRDVSRQHANLRRAVNTLRVSGAKRGQVQSAMARLTEVSSVLGVLQEESQARSREFNSSMARLNEACLRGG